MRKNLEVVWKLSGKKPKELADLPPLPPSLAYLWGWFCEVAAGEVLTYSEINAWAQLTRRELQPQEVHAIRALSIIQNNISNENTRLRFKKPAPKKK